MPRAVAAKLAPLLDQGKVTVEGTMLEGNSKPLRHNPRKRSSDWTQLAVSDTLS